MAELNAAGSITGTDGTVEIAPGDNATVAAALEGTWVATVNYEVTYDGVRWDAAQVFTLAGVAAAATATTNIDRLIDARGVERVRVRANPYTSGTINVVLSAGEGVVAAGGGGGGGAVTVADGADVTQGTTTDAAAAADTTNTTIVAFWKRLLQRVTVLIGQLPAALVGGRLDVNIGASAVTQAVSGTVTANAGTGTFTAAGDVASGAGDSGNPVKTGVVAVAHGADPTAVTAGQRINRYGNRHGVAFSIGGHPNVKTVRANYTAAQTDTALVTIAAGSKIVVTGFMITAHNANTVNVAAVLGFGTVNTPATTGVLGAHPGIAPGSGFGRGGGAGILGVGADDEDLRVTLGVPTGGSVDCVASYYTVPS